MAIQHFAACWIANLWTLLVTLSIGCGSECVFVLLSIKWAFQNRLLRKSDLTEKIIGGLKELHNGELKKCITRVIRWSKHIPLFGENGEMHAWLIGYLEGRDSSQDLDINDRISKWTIKEIVCWSVDLVNVAEDWYVMGSGERCNESLGSNKGKKAIIQLCRY